MKQRDPFLFKLKDSRTTVGRLNEDLWLALAFMPPPVAFIYRRDKNMHIPQKGPFIRCYQGDIRYRPVKGPF